MGLKDLALSQMTTARNRIHTFGALDVRAGAEIEMVVGIVVVVVDLHAGDPVEGVGAEVVEVRPAGVRVDLHGTAQVAGGARHEHAVAPVELVSLLQEKNIQQGGFEINLKAPT